MVQFCSNHLYQRTVPTQVTCVLWQTKHTTAVGENHQVISTDKFEGSLYFLTCKFYSHYHYGQFLWGQSDICNQYRTAQKQLVISECKVSIDTTHLAACLITNPQNFTSRCIKNILCKSDNIEKLGQLMENPKSSSIYNEDLTH